MAPPPKFSPYIPYNWSPCLISVIEEPEEAEDQETPQLVYEVHHYLLFQPNVPMKMISYLPLLLVNIEPALSVSVSKKRNGSMKMSLSPSSTAIPAEFLLWSAIAIRCPLLRRSWSIWRRRLTIGGRRSTERAGSMLTRSRGSCETICIGTLGPKMAKTKDYENLERGKPTSLFYYKSENSCLFPPSKLTKNIVSDIFVRSRAWHFDIFEYNKKRERRKWEQLS